MATSSSPSSSLLLQNNSQSLQLQNPSYMNSGNVSFLNSTTKVHLHLHGRRRSSHSSGSRKKHFVSNATPDAIAGDLLSTFPIPTIPGFTDSPWIAGVAGLLVMVPFVIQQLLTLTRGVDMAAETAEKIADVVGKVADEVDKAAEEMAAALPEGGLKQMVQFVEDLAEETVKDAQKVEDLMDKVEEMDDKLESILKNQSKGNEKA